MKNRVKILQNRKRWLKCPINSWKNKINSGRDVNYQIEGQQLVVRFHIYTDQLLRWLYAVSTRFPTAPLKCFRTECRKKCSTNAKKYENTLHHCKRSVWKKLSCVPESFPAAFQSEKRQRHRCLLLLKSNSGA
jgi:hypothetical protein